MWINCLFWRIDQHSRFADDILALMSLQTVCSFRVAFGSMITTVPNPWQRQSNLIDNAKVGGISSSVLCVLPFTFANQFSNKKRKCVRSTLINPFSLKTLVFLNQKITHQNFNKNNKWFCCTGLYWFERLTSPVGNKKRVETFRIFTNWFFSKLNLTHRGYANCLFIYL